MYTGVAVNGLVSAWAVFWGHRRYGAPGGLLAGGVGFLVAVAGAALDQWWHVNVGKDVNLWSPPHLVGLAGTAPIAIRLVSSVATHTRFAREPPRLMPPLVPLFLF